MTSLVHGDSYASSGFSTRTRFIETSTGKFRGNLESFHVTDNGRMVDAISRSYWGITFASDSNPFYVTLAVGANTHLIEGNLRAPRGSYLASEVECPFRNTPLMGVPFDRVDQPDGHEQGH